MKKILYFKLKILAKLVLKKYRPLVIAVTGSVGKTSTKDALYTLLRNHSRTWRTQGNYNNELGVPLTILGAESGGRSLLAWLKVFFKGLSLIVKDQPDYPEILILEMGAEKPGDISYLAGFVPVDIGILTRIAKVHFEFFNSLEDIAEEKFSLFKNFYNDSRVAILNIDDELIKSRLGRVKGKVITYGFAEEADWRASEPKIIDRDGVRGTLFKLHFNGQAIPIFLANVFGRSQVYACLAALVTSKVLNKNLLDSIEDLSKYHQPKGRTNLIGGIKNSWLLDDSYNASPESAKSALQVLAEMPTGGRKLAVFGNMLELGSYTEEGHKSVGQKAARLDLDMLVAVGEKAKDILRGAVEAGLPEEKTFYFSNNHEAGLFVQDKMREGDLVLIKGSQGARMEQITKELMAEPLKAGELLVRQSAKWLSR